MMFLTNKYTIYSRLKLGTYTTAIQMVKRKVLQ